MYRQVVHCMLLGLFYAILCRRSSPRTSATAAGKDLARPEPIPLMMHCIGAGHGSGRLLSGSQSHVRKLRYWKRLAGSEIQGAIQRLSARHYLLPENTLL